MKTMESIYETIFCLYLIIGSFVSVDGLNNKYDSMARIVNKSGSKRQDQIRSPTANTGEVVYEDESEGFQGDEDFNDPWIPPPPPPPQLFNDHHESFSPFLTKRFGSKFFGDDFALFLVLLTIAGFFGLIISLLMPFAFILSNGGVLPLSGFGGFGGLGGLGGLGGIGGINGINGLGGLGGLNGINGINGGFIGRKKRSEFHFKKKLIDLLTFLDIALEKYSTNT